MREFSRIIAKFLNLKLNGQINVIWRNLCSYNFLRIFAKFVKNKYAFCLLFLQRYTWWWLNYVFVFTTLLYLATRRIWPKKPHYYEQQIRNNKKKKKREKKTDLFQSAIFAKNNYQKKFITLEKQINTSADKHNKNKISRHLIVSKSSKANISPHCLVTNVFEFKINSQVIFPLYARGKPRGNKVSCTLILFLWFFYLSYFEIENDLWYCENNKILWEKYATMWNLK